MRTLLIAVTLLLALATFAHGLSIRSNHVGSLNHRLSREQLADVEPVNGIQPQWLTQKLDHQDLSSTATFQQKYYTNPDYFNPSQPRVFFMIGGEGPISSNYVAGHFIINDLAKQYGALVVGLEHRFYGESVPNNDSSTANLKFLSSSQALADMVTFHEEISKQYSLPAGTPWIVFGGSYSGSLSGWARLKYPNLFLGSYASSAPLQAQLDFPEYFQVVARSIGSDCNSMLAQANAQVNQMLQSSSGIQQLVADFNLCEAPSSSLDVANFLDSLSGVPSGVVQYSNDNNSYQPFNVSVMCSMLMSQSTPYQGLIAVWNANNKFNGDTDCTDINYANFVKSMQPSSAGRSWTWQTCTEFGYYQTAETTDQPFSSSIDLQFFLQQCQDIFGVENLQPNIDWINNYYGGRNIVTDNTVFANGDVDPWHILGTYRTFPSSSQSDAFLITGTAHCADLYPARSQDLPSLTNARVQQNALLGQWLKNGNPSQQKRQPEEAKILIE